MMPANHPSRRILFLSYWFPPAAAIACVRTLALAKYLSRRGWEITVVTPREEFWRQTDRDPLFADDWSRIRSIRTGCPWAWMVPGARAALHPFFGRVGAHISRCLHRFGIEPVRVWMQAARQELRHLKPGAADVVLASGPPFAAFSLAERLSVQLRCPFVMDYRDLWTSNPYDTRLHTRRNRKEEARLLGKCAAAVVVSLRSAEVLRPRACPGTVHVVTNGYDPDRLSGIVPRSFPDRALVYAGSLFPPLRTLEPVLQAMALATPRADTAQVPMRLHFFGDSGSTVVQRACELGLGPRVADHGRVPRQGALEALAGAHLVVVVESVLENADPAIRGVVPGKVFEALGLGKKILVIAPDGADLQEIVGQNGRRYSARQTRDIADYLLESTAAERPCAVAPPARYSWQRLAVAYDAIMRDVLDARSGLEHGVTP